MSAGKAGSRLPSIPFVPHVVFPFRPPVKTYSGQEQLGIGRMNRVIVWGAVLLALWIVKSYASAFLSRARLDKLGKRPVEKPHYLPFGIDIVFENVRVLIPLLNTVLIVSAA